MNHRIIHLLLGALILAGSLGGCKSPLDADTPRNVTPLTPFPKIDAQNIEFRMVTEVRRVSVEWYSDHSGSIQASTRCAYGWTSRLWRPVDRILRLIQAVRVRIDSIPADTKRWSIDGQTEGPAVDEGITGSVFLYDEPEQHRTCKTTSVCRRSTQQMC